MSPDTTGETENGRSINVTRTLLPGKANLAIAHAAARPKTRFSGTAMAAAESVRRMAAQVSGSANDARYAPTPFCKAWANTATTGRHTNKTRKVSAAPMRATRTTLDSVATTGGKASPTTILGGGPAGRPWRSAVLIRRSYASW